MDKQITKREKELIEEIEKLKADKKLAEDVLQSFVKAQEGMNAVLTRLNDFLEEEINENAKLVDPEEYEGHIQILNCLISYHERMTVPLNACKEYCGQTLCRAKLRTDIYLAALKESLRLIEREYKRYHKKETAPVGEKIKGERK